MTRMARSFELVGGDRDRAKLNLSHLRRSAKNRRNQVPTGLTHSESSR
ncbi:hypothetical protein RBWH47_05848 [Rhodopirellula baltica WH47]|uniref:Uncharacterized protein n=1 Tax=Rhodopirellula baltica WH47 TaxID=991778 RepID=F2ASP3_RHOBT|nr:hypothetical protein RBWH47_05848 [Rhodopirellula baltica WH47]